MKLFISMNEQGIFDILNSSYFPICGEKINTTHYELIFDTNGSLEKFKRTSLATHTHNDYKILSKNELTEMLPFYERDTKINNILN